jgi:hypothetical protein
MTVFSQLNLMVIYLREVNYTLKNAENPDVRTTDDHFDGSIPE